jgi:UPF0755 protein
MSLGDMWRAVKIVVGTMLAAALALGLFVWDMVRYPDHAVGGGLHQVQVSVEKGTSLREIARRLSDQEVIEHPSWFRFYAGQRGAAQKIKTGHYTFTSQMSPREILERLEKGTPVEQVLVTLPEGKNLLEVAEILDRAGVAPRAELERLARDPHFVEAQGISGPTLEGYLFPDTYYWKPATPAAQVLEKLVTKTKDELRKLKAQHPDGVAALRKSYAFGDREILIMASLVEKETARPEERPRIAGLFLNRLRLKTFIPHLLQTDPTIVYGCTVPLHKSAACKKFQGRIRRGQLDDPDNPYNTYTHDGLPPGPISNPGRAAILAVLKPDDTPYLYFVSKNDGTHYFSRTRAEHEAAVDKYQRHAAQ